MEEVILGFLNLADMTGYDIKRLISISTSFFYNASYGSIYPTLKKLEKKGLVKSKEVIEGRKVKVVYSITDEGRKVFLEWLGEPAAPANIRYEFLVKLFFARYLSKDKLLRMISDHIAEIQAALEKLKGIEMKVKDQVDIYQMYTLKFGTDFFTFLLKWYENLYEDIKGGDER